MRRITVVVVAACVVGCGRIGFDVGSGDAGSIDASDDARPDAPPMIQGMSFVTESAFVMGSDPTEGAVDERPEHVVTITRGYYVDQFEVTNREYRECVTDGACTVPSDLGSNTRTSYYLNVAFDDYPVVWVSWNQADAYCTWRGKRLPTEAEWEKAARGGCDAVAPDTCGAEDERRYPWGNTTPTCMHANIGNTNTSSFCITGGDTDRVGARSPIGDSPYGVSDMAGNVWEWVADRWTTDYTWCTTSCIDPTGPATGTDRIERGGGFLIDGQRVATTWRFGLPPTDSYVDLGFRCAKSL